MSAVSGEKLMRTQNFLTLTLFAIGLAGCMGQNPYPTSGFLTATPPTSRDVSPVWVIDAPQTAMFQEGQDGQFGIATRVPSGTPIVTVKNLPGTAKFDAVKGIVSWKPDMNAGHDPA